MNTTRWVVGAVLLGAGLSGIAAGWCLKNGPLQNAAAFHLTFSKNGARVYGVGSIPEGNKSRGFVGAWDTASGRMLWRSGAPGFSSYVAAAPDDKRVATVDWSAGGANDYTDVQVLDGKDGTVQWHRQLTRDKSVDIYAVRPPVFSADGRRLYLVYTDGIQVLDSATGGTITFWSSNGKNDTSIGRVLPSPDGKRLLIETRSDVYGGHNEAGDVVQVWDAQDGHLLRTLATGADIYTDFNPAGSALALVDSKGRLRVKDARTGQETQKAAIPNAAKATFEHVQFVADDTVEVVGRQKVAGKDGYTRWTWKTSVGVVRAAPAYSAGYHSDPTTRGNLIAVPARGGSFNTYPAALHDRNTGRKVRDLQNDTPRLGLSSSAL